ncbi:hypothetical protein SAMN02910353_01931 [Ruminococcus sp. YRD2003]|uniref:hypothetical protein n=1 Tax=Ruminococcus sp. YRD2003 TaxID=1452313 RepID=UPI0008CBDB7A|nr:hypothetical protein SAMN02910353_01931 [Ruminococcus flavefaciens]
MNKQTRLVVSFLFIILIILAAAITHFYFSVPENTATKNSQSEIVHKGTADGSGRYIFTDANGRYGVADSENRILIASEWTDLRFADPNMCIAARGIGNSKQFGCVDFDGNVVVPLIYSGISKLEAGGGTYYSAESSSDGRYVLYDRHFEPCFRRTWSSCAVQDDGLLLIDGGGRYSFSHSSDGLLFNRAVYDGEAGTCPYSVEINSRVLLSKLSPSMIEDMTRITEKYIEYAFTGSSEALSEITEKKHAEDFRQLFRGDSRLLSKKLVGISDVHIYSVRSKNDIPCYEVSFAADTEIAYSDEDGEQKALRDKYKAAVRFSGGSESELKAVSAQFEKDAPDYPQPEVKDEKPSDTGERAENTEGE